MRCASVVTVALASLASAQQPLEIFVDQHLAHLRIPEEELRAYGPSAATATGLQESLGVAGWYSHSLQVPGVLIDNILIVGIAVNGNGSVRHFTREMWSSNPYTLASANDSLSITPSGVAYDIVTQSIYIVDRRSKHVFKGSWDGEGSITSLATQSVFDASQYVPFGSIANITLLLLGNEIVRRGSLPIVRATAATELRISPRGTDLSAIYGTPAFAILDLSTLQGSVPTPPIIDGDNFILDERSFRKGALNVRIVVGEGQVHAYTLTRLDTGATLGTATQSAADREVVLPSSAPLEVGVEYCVHRNSDPSDAHCQRCMIRHGIPGELTSAGAIQMGELHFSGPLRAGGTLQISCPITAPTATPVQIVTAVTIAPSTVSGLDPIIPVGPHMFILRDPANFPTQTRSILGTVASWMIYDGILIPDVPGAVGSVFVFQAAALDGSGIYFSDILGAMVLPSR